MASCHSILKHKQKRQNKTTLIRIEELYSLVILLPSLLYTIIPKVDIQPHQTSSHSLYCST